MSTYNHGVYLLMALMRSANFGGGEGVVISQILYYLLSSALTKPEWKTTMFTQIFEIG